MEKVCKVSDIKDKVCLNVKGQKLALFKIKDKFYCIDNKCTHTGGPLCEGEVEGFNIVCPWHHSKFDIKTGKVTSGPARENVKSYKVNIKGDDIYVEV